MTGRGECILNFIRAYTAARGIAPTFREIGAGCGITSNSVVGYWLDKLEADGHLMRYKNVSRGVVLSEPI